MSLTIPELERYSRQLLMTEWSGEAQERLRGSRALVVGVGALGSPVATYLAAAGVGQLGIVDGDRVELSNLHRQPLHLTPDVGQPKAEVAAARLSLLNPEVLVEVYPVELTDQNAEAVVLGADVVVDCTDSLDSRYLVNDACCGQGVALVEAGVVAFEGLVLSVRPGDSACYRCVFPSAPSTGSGPSCREAGVLGAMAGIVGSIQALEALKLLTGVGEPLIDRMVQIDGRDMTQLVVHTSRRDGCPACAQVPAPAESGT